MVVSNTFTRHKEYKPYVKMAEELGIEVEIIILYTQYESIHDVPEHTMNAMRERFQE